LRLEAVRVAAREEILRGFLDVAVLRPTNFALGLGSLLARKLGELSIPVERLGDLVLAAMADEPAIIAAAAADLVAIRTRDPAAEAT
jgi:serine O-acetyltransferase